MLYLLHSCLSETLGKSQTEPSQTEPYLNIRRLLNLYLGLVIDWMRVNKCKHNPHKREEMILKVSEDWLN